MNPFPDTANPVGSRAESLGARLMPRHQGCFRSFKYGASSSETGGH
jgi:hypothetical protein